MPALTLDCTLLHRVFSATQNSMCLWSRPCFLLICDTIRRSLQSRCESLCSSLQHSSDSICRVTPTSTTDTPSTPLTTWWRFILTWNGILQAWLQGTWMTYFWTLGYCMSVMELVESLCLSFRWRGHMLSTQSIRSTYTDQKKIERTLSGPRQLLQSFCLQHNTVHFTCKT